MGTARRARSVSVRRAVATLVAAVCVSLVGPAAAHAAFGIDSLDTDTHSPVGGPSAPPSVHVDQAGARADSTMEFWLNRKVESGTEIPDGALQNVRVDLPPGFVGNPQAVPQCAPAQFVSLITKPCAPSTQVGYVDTFVGNDGDEVFPARSALYNLEPKRGEVAALGFIVVKIPVRISISLRTDGDYGVTATSDFINQGANVYGQRLTIWGVPADQVHDHQRFVNGSAGGFAAMGAPSGLPRRPFMSLPPTCPGPLATTMSVRAWRSLDWLAYQDYTDDPETGIVTGPTGCERVPFGAKMRVRPEESRASAPAAFTATFEAELHDSPDGIANAHVKDVSVKLPEGVSIAPGAADGLGGCSDAQLGLGTKDEPTCPASSKVGDVRIETSVLDEDVTGEVYLRESTPDRLFGLAVVARANGVLVKLPGEVDPDLRTGQITTTFRNNPQLPFERMTVAFKGGPRSPLVNPPACGTYTTETRITSWAGHAVTSRDSFEIDRAADGGACGPQPFAPALEAGSSSPVAGSKTGFSLIVSRPAGNQDLSTLMALMPKGLLADISSVRKCPDAAADAGGCGEDSRVGRVEVAAGEGSSPLWVPQPGKAPTSVHLAGPYRGAPYSLSILVPAQAGPFDLGRVVVRAPLHVDRSTAQVSSAIAQSRIYDRHGNLSEVVEGRMPTIMEGVILDQREIRVIVDREGFMLNPTSCAAKQVGVTLGSDQGQVRELADRFQVTNCAQLPFKPRLALALSGRRQRTTGKHPGVKAIVKQSGVGESGIGQAKVTLPKSLALDPDNAQALCEFVDGTKPDLESHCPKGSIVGKARAVTPLLDEPLHGNVYFVKNVRRDPRTGNAIRTLPMIVVALRGEIAINLKGESSTARDGRLVNTFASVPDAPIARFDLNIAGGKNGILAVTRTRKGKINLCSKPKGHRAEVEMDGHNGKRADDTVTVKTPCAGKKAGKRKSARKR